MLTADRDAAPPEVPTKFIVDHNVGKLVRWLRMIGCDSVFFTGEDDGLMVKQALAESRVILTRDTGMMLRRMITSGRVKAILFQTEVPEEQMKQLLTAPGIEIEPRPFTLCLEDNAPLITAVKESVKDRVPPYVLKTQAQYMECPACRRVYWRGTHWLAMLHKIERLTSTAKESVSKANIND